MSIRIIKSDNPLSDPRVKGLLSVLQGTGLQSADQEGALDVPQIVKDILKHVATEGDRAAAELTSKLDRADVTPESLRVPDEDIKEAAEDVDPSFLELTERVVENIRAYQIHILQSAPPALVRGGRRIGVRYTPINRVAVYVPGGKAFYPSTVLMTVVPAMVAGVPEIVMATPPTDGEINPMILALANMLGVSEVYRLGGAVAIAALAYGTETIRPVDKIVGPGNAFVAEAKRQLYGVVGIDSIAGPSEVLIVADDTARADWIASDLLAQAEHDPGSAVLVTPSAGLAENVSRALKGQLSQLQRAEATTAALDKYGAIIVTPGLESACDVANVFATEHLQLMTADNDLCLERIHNGGAIFVGPHTPVPLGDYYAGPSHVLPTGGTARFSGPLSCNDFLKASSIIEYDRDSLADDAKSVADFATREGLTAHAKAVTWRSGAPKSRRIFINMKHDEDDAKP